MTKYIAVSNRRGGVGKTTTTMMLAYGLAVLGYQRVLVIDLDAQASTSITLMGHERWRLARDHSKTVGDLLIEMFGDDHVDVTPFIAPQVGDVHIMPGARRPILDVIPSSFELDNREREMLIMGGASGPTIDAVFDKLQLSVARLIRSLEGHYDIVLMDCPPGLSNVAWGAIRAADHVVIPYVPDATAEDNVGWFTRRLQDLDPAKQVRVLANRVRPNSAFQAGIIDSITNRHTSLGLQVPIRAAIAGALEFRTHSQPIRSKFGDGAVVVERLMSCMLEWFEQSTTRRAPALEEERL